MVPCGPNYSPCFLHIDAFALPTAHQGPVVVMIPGGPLQIGNRGYLWTLARWLAARGAVVYTSDYRSGPEYGGGYPVTFADVACAIRFARANSPKLGGDPTRVTLVGHSYGGFVGAVVSLSAHDFGGEDPGCTTTTGDGRPNAFVGIAGIYSLDRLGLDFLDGFFGSDRTSGSAATWDAGDPLRLAAAKTVRRIPIRLAAGTADTTAPLAGATELATALGSSEDVTVTTMDGATHDSILGLPATVDLVEATMKGR